MLIGWLSSGLNIDHIHSGVHTTYEDAPAAQYGAQLFWR